MEMCLDEKWKLSSSSKKGSRRSAAVAPAATSPRGLNKGRTTSSRGPAARSAAVHGRLASLVKEQRARFYIVRRCVTMLVCWRD
ncbi:hypothetical protein BDA96_08G153700 [Sorghum bicolor]|uniref:ROTUNDIFOLIA like 8 n=2 Tax=Sorghum bicolor TaxID=4558 RepID=A0A921QI92_SORBI|nr:hypothetical protein BDA96_08G153700 [Sorghum bicolor]KXG23778.1 hypothetical protein SORBI_3008G139300 [Sorghum bicolor]